MSHAHKKFWASLSESDKKVRLVRLAQARVLAAKTRRDTASAGVEAARHGIVKAVGLSAAQAVRSLRLASQKDSLGITAHLAAAVLRSVGGSAIVHDRAVLFTPSDFLKFAASINPSQRVELAVADLSKLHV